MFIYLFICFGIGAMTRSLSAEQVVDNIAGLETSSRLKSTVPGLGLSPGKKLFSFVIIIDLFFFLLFSLLVSPKLFSCSVYCRIDCHSSLLFLSTLALSDVLETTSLLHGCVLTYFPIVHLSPKPNREA